MSRHGLVGALFATFCATSATASFMAYDFHELSPYVLIGNPLDPRDDRAVRGSRRAARLGALSVRTRRLVWSYLGAGIETIMTVARWIGAAPGAIWRCRLSRPGRSPF